MGKEAVRVVKDSTVKKFDEPTFARLTGTDFKNGTIEVRVLSRLLPDAPEFARGFIGLAFHINDSNTRYESYADMALHQWITMRIVVKDGQARLFLNGSKQPNLVVSDLKFGPGATGAIGLWVDIGTEGFFSDLKVLH